MPNDTGSNYFFIPGGEAPAPPVAPPPVTEPVSPFEKYLMALENLQPPVEFFPNSYQEPSAPAFTPMAAPAAVQVSPASKFGPVTQSGYALPPVDPMSYYSDPDLSNPQTLNQEQPSTPSIVGGNTSVLDQPSTLDTRGESWRLVNDNWIDTVPNPEFVEPRDVPNPPRIGLPPIPPGMIEPVMDYDKWQWIDRRIPKPDKPAPPKEDENVKYLTPEEVEQMLGGQTPTPPVPPQEEVPLLAPGIPPTTGLPTIVKPRPVVSIPKPNLNLPEPPKYTDTVRNPGRIIPFKMPTEVPIPARRAAELLAPGYSQDINYDPDEILAAAMRVIRGRSAGRSLMY